MCVLEGFRFFKDRLGGGEKENRRSLFTVLYFSFAHPALTLVCSLCSRARLLSKIKIKQCLCTG